MLCFCAARRFYMNILVLSSQERPPFIPEGVVARRRRMETGEPRRKRVGPRRPHPFTRGGWELCA